MKTKLETFLDNYDEKSWLAAIENLLSAIHDVDKNAVQIWFRFFPLELFRYLQSAEDKEKAIQKFVMQGNYELKNQIDSSHKFLYGHRFWTETKAEIQRRAESFNNETNNEKPDLSGVIEQIGQAVAGKMKVDKSLTISIAAIGLMTLVQAGYEDFVNAKGETEKPKGLLFKSPDAILKERLKVDSQGILGFLKTVDKKYTVVYDETVSGGKFSIINDEEIASASARNQSKNWKEMDERCWEGVIPVECRSAACGTCWVGVLEGEEKLSEVSRMERKQMKVFGYNQPTEAKPFLRLACQARGYGAVSLVIPPWNGVFGKTVYGVEDVELEPATTSAKKLRETVSQAVNNPK